MNIVFDLGNTHMKVAIFENEKMIWQKQYLYEEIHTKIEVLKNKFPQIKNGIISTVIGIENTIVKTIQKHFCTLVLSSKLKLPFKNLYKTTKSLGADRMALVSAAVGKYPNENVLIIDLGTCITYDVVTDQNEYLGGVISLGLYTRAKAINYYTKKLPLLDIKDKFELVGKTTKECIQTGIFQGVIHEIEGFIKDYKNKFKDLKIIVTGGDAKKVERYIKTTIFAHNNFLLYGLNIILKHN